MKNLFFFTISSKYILTNSSLSIIKQSCFLWLSWSLRLTKQFVHMVSESNFTFRKSTAISLLCSSNTFRISPFFVFTWRSFLTPSQRLFLVVQVNGISIAFIYCSLSNCPYEFIQMNKTKDFQNHFWNL